MGDMPSCTAQAVRRRSWPHQTHTYPVLNGPDSRLLRGPCPQDRCGHVLAVMTVRVQRGLVVL
jgi:hypothetical protein